MSVETPRTNPSDEPPTCRQPRNEPRLAPGPLRGGKALHRREPDLTASSLFIRRRPTHVSAADLERPDLNAEVLRRLPEFADRCGPYGLQFWAKARGLPLHYVDNCWVRAEVKGAELPAFFAEVLQASAVPEGTFAPDETYLIEAEEF